MKDPTKPFALALRFQVKDGAGAKFEAAFARAIKLTRQEKGCLAYDLNQDPKMPNQYLVYERWQNLAALEAHQNSAHIAALRKETGDLRAGAPEVHVLIVVGE